MSRDDKIKGAVMTKKTTDRELLELAAKAVGMHVKAQRVDADDKFTHLVVGQKFKPEKIDWNPLTDDGDALRLAVKLGLRVCIDNRAGVSWIKRFEGSTAHGDDAASATRRAIVRAAAEIGKTMP